MRHVSAFHDQMITDVYAVRLGLADFDDQARTALKRADSRHYLYPALAPAASLREGFWLRGRYVLLTGVLLWPM